MNVRRVSLVAIAPLLVIFAASADTPTVSPADPNRYIADIKVLASPEFEGRGAGTKGIERATKMLEQRYKSLGLEPAGMKGFLQPFTVTTGAKLKSDNRASVNKAELQLTKDYVPFSFSSSGTVTAPLVFVGYGASADEFQYDDYAGQDVKDKIVVVLRYEPDSFSKNGKDGLTQHSHLITKAINARNHGAKAVIIVNGKLADNEEDVLPRFGSTSGPQDSGILLIQVKNAVADEWFKAAGKSLTEVQMQIAHSGKPNSFAFPADMQATIKVDIEGTHARVNNVLAYLPGKRDEYVIIGAHYDHLGYGDSNSLAPSQIGHIHPGADDNGSGTAGVLELARVLAPLKGQLPRGILFMSFAGEELGLLGSAEWVKHPTKPLDKAVAMLNMDMIGRIKDDKVFIGGVGTGSSFKQFLEEDQPKSGFKVEYSQGGYSASDHTSFVTAKIPVLFFFSGLHSDYHKPSDTWDKINAPEAAKLLNLVDQVALQIDEDAKRPEFKTVIEDKPVGGGGSGYGPYFGSIPDFGEVKEGVKFSDVRPGSPAAKAGLKGGDILVQFGDKPIKNLYDFTDALRRSKVGDVVKVKVLRDGQPIEADVKLEQRK
ncbi:peptidase M28 [Candidatus Koribacter versatilis Ellin345]|uniref:Peptidase M28 n=1 Tax=Koribacter versatilis (strain Ellin345) TaxID=204669 RepID=Q1IKW6_KORVE|nr:M28 family peptidase [Candidatus Koribacter versatilis]ABF42484.1 peptidase M28 [Candidatus Koribacter versatilis Ellin345]